MSKFNQNLTQIQSTKDSTAHTNIEFANMDYLCVKY